MRLIFVAYNGMARRIDQGSMAEMRSASKHFRDRKEKIGYDVTQLSPQEWEVQYPGSGVSDHEGYLKIVGDDALKREYGR